MSAGLAKVFVLLATLNAPDGFHVYALDFGLTGADCVAGMEEGIDPATESAIRAFGELPPGVSDLSGAVLSCEFDR